MRCDPRPPAPDSDEVFLNARAVNARYGVSPMWIWRRLRDESGFPNRSPSPHEDFGACPRLSSGSGRRAAGRADEPKRKGRSFRQRTRPSV